MRAHLVVIALGASLLAGCSCGPPAGNDAGAGGGSGAAGGGSGGQGGGGGASSCNLGCFPPTPACDNGTCVECLGDSDCNGATCDTAAKKCRLADGGGTGGGSGTGGGTGTGGGFASDAGGDTCADPIQLFGGPVAPTQVATYSVAHTQYKDDTHGSC